MKKVFSLVAIAIVFASCSTIKVAPGKPVAFKDLKGKKVMLTEKPGYDDTIVISIIKKVHEPEPALDHNSPVKVKGY